MNTTMKHNHGDSRSRALALAAVGLVAMGGLSACSDSSTTTAADNSSQACPISVADGWVKAADTGMTAAFGTVVNTSADDVIISAATTPAATTMELHEVVQDNGETVMQPVADGFPVPADGELALEPGGYHLMLMDITEPIQPGDDVTFTLNCSDGATAQFTAQAKAYEGAEEQYEEGGMDTMGDKQDVAEMTPDPEMS